MNGKKNPPLTVIITVATAMTSTRIFVEGGSGDNHHNFGDSHNGNGGNGGPAPV
jgi:hypothetical protein